MYLRAKHHNKFHYYVGIHFAQLGIEIQDIQMEFILKEIRAGLVGIFCSRIECFLLFAENTETNASCDLSNKKWVSTCYIAFLYLKTSRL